MALFLYQVGSAFMARYALEVVAPGLGTITMGILFAIPILLGAISPLLKGRTS